MSSTGAKKLTLERGVLWQMKGSMLPGNSILGIAATGRGHLVESRDAVSRLKLGHILTNGFDDTCNVVALIARFVKPLWELPAVFSVSLLTFDPNTAKS
jgi:hypothetical protein